MPQGLAGIHIGIECVNTVVFRGHVDDVVSYVRYRDIGRVEWLRKYLAVDGTAEQFPERWARCAA
jgi:hypothetical protein